MSVDTPEAEISSAPGRMAQRRHRKTFDAARRAARAENLRQWLDGRSKAAKKRHDDYLVERAGSRPDLRPAFVQDVDGLGGPVLEGATFTSNRAMIRAFVGGRSRRVRRVTASSAVHAVKAPASLNTHLRVRLVERTGEATDFGRVTVFEAAQILAGAK